MEEFYNRLKKNYKHKSKWAKKLPTQAYRLYEKDLPNYPYIIDIYGNFLIIFFKGDSRDTVIADWSSIFSKILPFSHEIIFKIRDKQKGKDQYKKIENLQRFIEIKEYQASFLINPYDYLDVGLFLDHRPMRQKLFSTSTNKKILNLFCYTSSVSLFAALGGAKKVTSVDLSRTYLDWSIKNFKLNNIDIKQHQFIQENVSHFLKEDKDQYDIIFLDPPTFSNSKKVKDVFEVEKDHIELIHDCMKRLPHSGVLYFSNNKRSFKISSEIENTYQVQNISLETIPLDFKDKKIHQCYEIKKA